MIYQSVIVKLFSGMKPLCLFFPAVAKTTIFDLKQIIFGRLLVEPKNQKLITISGICLNDSTRIFENDDVEFTTLTLKLPLYGGKGGFNTMLRAQEPERERAHNEKMQRKIENGFNERQTKKNKFDDSEFLKQGEEMKENVQMAATEALKKSFNITTIITTNTIATQSAIYTTIATPTKSINTNALSMCSEDNDDVEMTDSDA
ncbi:804_t:CDS:2 [Entrophospora sp. SA101]|nr:804_t:CDS:2 [Entrophospora sp. SA101]